MTQKDPALVSPNVKRVLAETPLRFTLMRTPRITLGKPVGVRFALVKQPE